jgi:hypothetical protein
MPVSIHPEVDSGELGVSVLVLHRRGVLQVNLAVGYSLIPHAHQARTRVLLTRRYAVPILGSDERININIHDNQRGSRVDGRTNY